MLMREKYYKKQIEILDNIDLKAELEQLGNEKIVGYLFYCKANGEKLLNLYLNEKDNIVDKQEIVDNLSVFKNSNNAVFKNPPLEIWLENKESWCKNLARNLANKFNLDYEEVLSEVYFNVVKLYKKNKFLDNLGYTQMSVKNSVLNKIRSDKVRLTSDNSAVLSLDSVIPNCEDNNITLAQVIEDTNCVSPERNAEFLSVKNSIFKTLEKSFTKQEIEQITTCKVRELPSGLFNRLARWRKRNTLEKVLER